MKKLVVALAICSALLAALVACRSPLHGTNDTTDVSIRIGGVLPPTLSDSATRHGARVIVPAAVQLRVTADWERGGQLIQTSQVAGGQATIRRLPVGVAISLYLEALDSSGTVLSVGTLALAPLGEGLNAAPAVTLKPSPAMATDDLGAMSAGMSSARSVGAQGVRYYTFTAGDGLSGDFQVVFDTGKARWVWLKAYDEDWNELPAICSDASQGWVVVRLAETQTVNLAVSNSVGSPGYPAGAIDGAIVVRPAKFCTADALELGDGSLSAPLTIESIGSMCDSGDSLFVRGGLYDASAQVTSSLGDLYVYGGFSPDWKTRDARLYETRIGSSGEVPDLVRVAGGGLLDGIRITAIPLSGSVMNTCGLILKPQSALVINDCRIYGGTNYEAISSQSIGSVAVNVTSETGGTIEMASCELYAGGANNLDEFPASTYALSVSSSVVYVHDCDIDGGFAQSPGGASTHGVWVTNAYVILARSRVWGGIAKSSSVDYDASAAGVFAEYGTRTVAIVNSLVSGGYSSNSAAGGREYLRGVETYQQPIRICGSVIDSGFCPEPVETYSYVSATSTEESGTVQIESSIVITSNATAFGDLFYDAEMPNSATTCYGCLAAHPGEFSYGGSDSAFPEPIAGNEDLPNLALGGFFTAFSNAYTGSYPSDYERWLGGSWRVSPGYSAYIGGGNLPYSGGSVAGFSVADYPALVLDLAGKARPTSGSWGRGAYE